MTIEANCVIHNIRSQGRAAEYRFGGDYEASRIVQSMASGWLMPYHKVGQADLEFSSRKSEAEFNLVINIASFSGEH